MSVVGDVIRPTGIVNTNNVVIINQPLDQNSGQVVNPVKPNLYSVSPSVTSNHASDKLSQKPRPAYARIQ